MINEYLSEEREISIPDKIMGIKVCYIDEDAFNRMGTDVVILDIPEGIEAGKVYHQESQSYYWLYDVHATGGSVNMTIKERLAIIPYEACVGLASTIVSVLIYLI